MDVLDVRNMTGEEAMLLMLLQRVDKAEAALERLPTDLKEKLKDHDGKITDLQLQRAAAAAAVPGGGDPRPTKIESNCFVAMVIMIGIILVVHLCESFYSFVFK